MARTYDQIIRENIDNIREWRGEGFTVNQIGNKLGMKPRTIYLFIRTIPELADAWEAGNTALVKDVLEPAIIRQAIEGLPYREVTEERQKVILPDGSERYEMVQTKIVHKRVYSPQILKYVLGCLAPEKWGAKVELKDEQKGLELGEGMESYGV